MMSLGLRIANTQSTLLNQQNSDSRTNFGLPNLALVVAGGNKDATNGISSFAFAIGYNQLMNYNRRLTGRAINPLNSLNDFLYNQYLNDSSSFYGNLGLQSSLIGFDQTGRPLPAIVNFPIEQLYSRNEFGRWNEWAISFAGGQVNKFLFGLTIGIPDISFTGEITHIEKDTYYKNNSEFQTTDQRTTFGVQEVVMSDNFKTRGGGINLRLGAIFIPIEQLRLSFSAATPSLLSLTDSYQTRIEVKYDPNPQYGKRTAQSEPGTFDYTLTTPYRVNLGAAYIHTHGFISADVGFTDYSTARFSLPNTGNVGGGNTYFFDTNKLIADRFAFGYNYSIGTEYKIEDFYLRAGYAGFSPGETPEARKYTQILVSRPFENATESNTRIKNETAKLQRYQISAGVGYRSRQAYIDFTGVYQVDTDKFTVYSLENDINRLYTISPVIINTRKMLSFIISAGYRF
jgi:hypothetical protein